MIFIQRDEQNDTSVRQDSVKKKNPFFFAKKQWKGSRICFIFISGILCEGLAQYLKIEIFFEGFVQCKKKIKQIFFESKKNKQ